MDFYTWPNFGSPLNVVRRQLDDVAQVGVLDEAVAAADADVDVDAVVRDVDEAGRISENAKIWKM